MHKSLTYIRTLIFGLYFLDLSHSMYLGNILIISNSYTSKAQEPFPFQFKKLVAISAFIKRPLRRDSLSERVKNKPDLKEATH